MNTLLGVFQEFILSPCLICFHAISFTPFHDIPVINYADYNTSCFTGLTLRLGGIQWSSLASFFVVTWKPLLYQPWCSRTFNQICMGFTLIMLPKLFKALARSDVIILTSLSLSYHYIAIIILPNFGVWRHF